MPMNRREFMKISAGASGGLVLSLSLPGCAGVQTGFRPESGAWKPDAWLEITRQNEILFTLARVEMGQGTYTGLTTLVAEELEVRPEAITLRFAPVAPAYRNPLYGRTSVRPGKAGLCILTALTPCRTATWLNWRRAR